MNSFSERRSLSSVEYIRAPGSTPSILGVCLALTELANGGESATRSCLALDSSKIGRAVRLGLRRQRLGNFGADRRRLILGAAEHIGLLVILSLVRRALGIEPGGGLLPTFRRAFCVLGLICEAFQFLGDQVHGAVRYETLHGVDGLGGGVVESTVCPVAFHRLNELRPRIGHILGNIVQPVLLAASHHADVDACRARRLAEHCAKLWADHPPHPLTRGQSDRVLLERRRVVLSEHGCYFQAVRGGVGAAVGPLPVNSTLAALRVITDPVHHRSQRRP